MREFEFIANQIIDSSYDVHVEMGPGLLESVYQKCLIYELRLRGFSVQREVSIPLQYKGVSLDSEYRIDILVENQIIIELKLVQEILPIHKAQLLSYLDLAT
ncbi:GxxExxY protein [Halosquirtibacter xylanolyticus]|uniref:GxxExxY protein n=1 Tax=Halosquirtibacter xylanolyticus TaxID=3374599 RepID=UPI0037478BB6|nr:GxxExxY protein [Prolixibacteraceae bacterium]